MRKLIFLVTLVSILVLILVLNVGVAFAHDAPGLENAPCAPVGSHIPDAAWDNNKFPFILANNPLCPLH